MNVNKLKGKIVENGLNVSQLASSIGIDKTTLYRKLTSNGDTLTISEAEKIARTLNLSMEDVNAIFFTDFVA
jgi:putative cro-like protein